MADNVRALKKLNEVAEKLLDLGKTNQLINLKTAGGRAVEVLLPQANELFEELRKEKVFPLFVPDKGSFEKNESADDIATEIAEQDAGAQNTEGENGAGEKDNASSASSGSAVKGRRGTSRREGLGIGLGRDDYKEKFGGKLKANTILPYTSSTTRDVEFVLTQIEKTGRSSYEENGVNVLFVAFGIISWREKESDERVYKAPLLLLPVALEKTIGSTCSFKLKGTDDDVVVNPTFMLKLHREFKIDLPEFGEEDTLDGYLAKVTPLLAQAKYTISSEVALGVFSFVKISMYHDLMEHADEILKNSDVRAILGESEEDNVGNQGEEPKNNEDDNPLVSLHNVVDADGTQLAAVKAAASGKSFVLQGPPGTGKSQTITNIIAEILAQGRRVLFVSEKQAALRVVYNKMKKAGLEDFCLEIHSSKANKKEVISEVCRTLQLNHVRTTEKADRDSSRRCELIGELEGYEHVLHEKIPALRQSLYELYEEYWRLAGKVKEVPDQAFYDIPNVTSLDQEYCDRIYHELQKFSSFTATFGGGADIRLNPWYGCRADCANESARRRFLSGIEEMMPLVGTLARTVAAFAQSGFRGDLSLDELRVFADLDAFMGQAKFALAKDLADGGTSLRQAADALADEGRKLAEIYRGIEQVCDGDFMSFNAAETEAELSNSYSGSVSRMFSSMFGGGYKKLLAAIAAIRKDRKAPDYEEATGFCHTLADLQNRTRVFAQKLTALLPAKSASTSAPVFMMDWDKLESEAQTLEKFGALEFLAKAAVDDTSCAEARRMSAEVAKQFAENESFWHGEGSAAVMEQFDESLCDLNKISIKSLACKCTGCFEHRDELDSWREFAVVLRTLWQEKLQDFIFTYASSGADSKYIADYYRYSWVRGRIEHIIADNQILSGFSNVEHSRAISEFKSLDKNIFNINCVYIKSRLSDKRPDLNALVRSSPVYEILREGQKKSRLMNVRDFMSKYGDYIMDVKPCFLMSPLSVSTFLKPICGLFDTIIFDEASQIFAQDALGAIYRGKQVIVVGDSKQMPPSNFFGSSGDGEVDDEATDISSFESILDLCAGSFKNLRLNWHYRSRFEELIAFSNRFIYDGTLVSFPSIIKASEWNGVSYQYVPDAVYANNINVKEAEAVVERVFANLKQFPKRSLGVVTFSIKQQTLIERLIEKARVARPEFEEFFAQTREEPFFVKNLETVQGDERDTIIFSITYGRDASGRFSRNFGPLSREGGERRLNVAVTRAKSSVQVVSSIHAADIDLKGLTFRGPELLHHYLDYAERGTAALDAVIKVGGSDWFDSPFEESVANFLREHGYTVDTQIGCSSYRIDLGLRQPQSSNYLLAIECDGATYHSSKNARDRDRLRQSVLEGMGWKFYRIWSTDWFRNGNQARQNLLNAVEAAVAGRALKEPEPPAPKTVSPKTGTNGQEGSGSGYASGNTSASASSSSSSSSLSADVKNTAEAQEKTLCQGGNASASASHAEGSVQSPLPKSGASAVTASLNEKAGGTSTAALRVQENAYAVEEAPATGSMFSKFTKADDAVVYAESMHNFPQTTKRIIALEGAVSEEALFKRLFAVRSKSGRISADFKSEVLVCLQHYAEKYGLERRGYDDPFGGSGQIWFWNLRDGESMLKVPEDTASRREISSISPAEIATGMHSLIAINKSCNRSELYRKINSELGYQKVTEKTQKWFDVAFKLLSQEDRDCVDVNS